MNNYIFHRYEEVDGYDASKNAISVYTLIKKEDTPEEFFAGAIKKMVGDIRESAWVRVPILKFICHYAQLKSLSLSF